MKKLIAGVSHHERSLEELRADREYAIALLQLSLESLENPEERGGALLSIRAVAEAYGGLGAVAAEAGISRESLYRSLSPKGNPTLKTLVAVLKTMGLRLSVTNLQKGEKAQSKKRNNYAAACPPLILRPLGIRVPLPTPRNLQPMLHQRQNRSQAL